MNPKVQQMIQHKQRYFVFFLLLLICTSRNQAQGFGINIMTPSTKKPHTKMIPYYHHHHQVLDRRWHRHLSILELQSNENQDNKPYSFWNDAISCHSFNLDLQHLVEEDNVQRAQDALEIMEELYQKDPSSFVLPNVACYTTVLQGWMQSSHPEAVEKAQALRDRIAQMKEESFES